MDISVFLLGDRSNEDFLGLECSSVNYSARTSLVRKGCCGTVIPIRIGGSIRRASVCPEQDKSILHGRFVVELALLTYNRKFGKEEDVGSVLL